MGIRPMSTQGWPTAPFWLRHINLRPSVLFEVKLCGPQRSTDTMAAAIGHDIGDLCIAHAKCQMLHATHKSQLQHAARHRLHMVAQVLSINI